MTDGRTHYHHANRYGRMIAPSLEPLEQLHAVLERHALDRTFEGFGGFMDTDPRDVHGQPLLDAGWVRFHGNFAAVSNAFTVDSCDPAVIERLAAAILANIASPTYQAQPPYFDPRKLVIERKRFSTTQGEVALTYAGELLGQYGDKIELRGRDWHGQDDRYWIDAARKIMAKRHAETIAQAA